MKRIDRKRLFGCLIAGVFLGTAANGLDFAEVGPEEYRPLRRELRRFYPDECHERMKSAAVNDSWEKMFAEVEAHFRDHPQADALEIRRENYRAIRRHFLPILFDESPFYFEAGAAGGYAERNRRPVCPGNITRVLCERFYRDRGLIDPAEFKVQSERSKQCYSYICGPFVDQIHNIPPFLPILEKGFGGVRKDVEKAIADCPAWDADGRRYLEMMLEGLDTVHVIQLKFAEEAERRLAQSAGLPARQAKNLRRIADAAKRCPWEPPRTFFEALNTIQFCREIFGYVDGLSCFSHGHPDAWLIGYYERDLKAGVLTREEARDLICRFLVICECHHDGFRKIDGAADQEMETQITLGGCHRDGTSVWNELTKMFLEEHLRLKVVFPKLHVRYSKDSPRDYLEAIAEQVLGGHCVFAMFNDDAHIPGFLKDGYSIEEARDYLCCGCWEGFVSRSDVSTANYTSVFQPFVASIYTDREKETLVKADITPIEGCADFESLKRVALGNYLRYVKTLVSDYTRYGRFFARIAPRPLYSSCLEGCIERRRDEHDLGLKFHQRVLTLGFLANTVDSMCAIDKVVYRDRFCTMGELLAAVRSNWKGERAQAIRDEVLKAPYWGDNSKESNSLMKWWIDEIAFALEGLRTDQGGVYKASCLIYREFLFYGLRTPATPDGRYSGDRFAQGFAPSEYRCKTGVSDVFNAIASLDHTKLCASNANLTFGGEELTPETLAAVFRVYARNGRHMLQPNCNDVETLLDAQRHPERHLDLMVKVCGFSARFISLSRRFQDEVIARHRLHCSK